MPPSNACLCRHRGGYCPSPGSKEGVFVVLTSITAVTPLPQVRNDRPYQLRGLHVRAGYTRRSTPTRWLIRHILLESPPGYMQATKVHKEGADLDLAQSWIAECCRIHDCEDIAHNDDNGVQDSVKRLF